MELVRKYFPELLPDNEELYFAHLEGILSSVDELAHIQISKLGNKYHFRIAPSLPRYNPLLLEELLKYHNTLGLRLDLSKSIKTSASIVFEINLG
jgi:hypothetical protein